MENSIYKYFFHLPALLFVYEKKNYSLYFIFLFSFFHSQISDTSNSIFIAQESTIYVTSDTDNLVYAYSGNEMSTHLNTHTSYKTPKKENQSLPVSRETSKDLTTSSEVMDDRGWGIPPLEPSSFLLSHTGSRYSIIPFSSYNFKMLFTDTSQKVLSSSLILSGCIKHKLSYSISYYFEIFLPFLSRPPPHCLV